MDEKELDTDKQLEINIRELLAEEVENKKVKFFITVGDEEIVCNQESIYYVFHSNIWDVLDISAKTIAVVWLNKLLTDNSKAEELPLVIDFNEEEVVGYGYNEEKKCSTLCINPYGLEDALSSFVFLTLVQLHLENSILISAIDYKEGKDVSYPIEAIANAFIDIPVENYKVIDMFEKLSKEKIRDFVIGYNQPIELEKRKAVDIVDEYIKVVEKGIGIKNVEWENMKIEMKNFYEKADKLFDIAYKLSRRTEVYVEKFNHVIEVLKDMHDKISLKDIETNKNIELCDI